MRSNSQILRGIGLLLCKVKPIHLDQMTRSFFARTNASHVEEACMPGLTMGPDMEMRSGHDGCLTSLEGVVGAAQSPRTGW